MKEVKQIKTIALSLVAALFFSSANAQSNTYILPGSFVGFFSDTIWVYGDLINGGGTVHLAANANMLVYGDSFSSTATSTYSGTGTIHMKGPRPAPYAGTFEQFLDNNGVKVVNLNIDNASDVQMASDGGVTTEVSFANGKVFHNANDFTVGSGGPGVISGYDENKYFVTNGVAGDVSGFLVRENTGAGAVVFPVGSNSASATLQYAPAEITNAGTSDNFSVRVFPGVWVDGNSTASGANFNKSNNQTWDVREGTVGGSNATLNFQHMASNNGPTYIAYPTRRFVSHYVGTAPNNAGDTVSNTGWSNVKLSSTSSETSPGTLTTGAPIAGADMLSITGITSFSPFAKTIQSFLLNATPLNIKFLNVDAKWINTSDAKVSWTAADEVENTTYYVWRKLKGSSTFTNIGSVEGNGKSIDAQSYSLNDLGVAELANGHVLYKIEAKTTLGSHFSEIVMLNTLDNASSAISVYPNPSKDVVYVSLPEDEVATYTLFDAAGKMVKQNLTELSNFVIDVKDVTPGIYNLRINMGQQHASVIKLMVNH